MKLTKFTFLSIVQLNGPLGLRAFSVSLRSAAEQHPLPKDDYNIRQCYKVLGVNSECSNDEVRDAYLHLAKRYHPDGATQFSNADTFITVENAYRKVMHHRKKTGMAPRDLEEVVFDIKHVAPQHRQYLTFDGVGYGSPGQRERQYQQKKAMQAIDTVYEYRTQQISVLHENSMVVKDKKETKKHIVRSAIDRLVEDLISESMAKGDFDNLPGSGKPLPHSDHNPYIDTMTHNLNKILINNGYVPQWVTLEKEIRKTLSTARDDLLKTRLCTGREPISVDKKVIWSKKVAEFREAIIIVNKKIDQLNMVVPTLRQQMVHYDSNKELEKILRRCKELENFPHPDDPLSPDLFQGLNRKGEEITGGGEGCSSSSQNEQKIRLSDILRELKFLLFSKS